MGGTDFCTLAGQGCLIPHPSRTVAGGLGMGWGCCWPLNHTWAGGRGVPRWEEQSPRSLAPDRAASMQPEETEAGAWWAWGLWS